MICDFGSQDRGLVPDEEVLFQQVEDLHVFIQLALFNAKLLGPASQSIASQISRFSCH